MLHKFCLLIQLLLFLMVLVCMASTRHLRSVVRRGIFVKWWLLFFIILSLGEGIGSEFSSSAFSWIKQFCWGASGEGRWPERTIRSDVFSPTGISPVSQWPKSRSKYFRELRGQVWFSFWIFFFFFFWWHSIACRILVSQPGIKPVSSAVEA